MIDIDLDDSRANGIDDSILGYYLFNVYCISEMLSDLENLDEYKVVSASDNKVVSASDNKHTEIKHEGKLVNEDENERLIIKGLLWKFVDKLNERKIIYKDVFKSDASIKLFPLILPTDVVGIILLYDIIHDKENAIRRLLE